jgi:hypothetical protein
MHIGLWAIDITRLNDYAVIENGSRSSPLNKDLFADLVVNPLDVP